MAGRAGRTYKRDGNGRFASTGGGGSKRPAAKRVAKGPNRLTRDNSGKITSVGGNGATVRGGRLRTASGKLRARQTARVKAPGAKTGTIAKGGRGVSGAVARSLAAVRKDKQRANTAPKTNKAKRSKIQVSTNKPLGWKMEDIGPGGKVSRTTYGGSWAKPQKTKRPERPAMRPGPQAEKFPIKAYAQNVRDIRNTLKRTDLRQDSRKEMEYGYKLAKTALNRRIKRERGARRGLKPRTFSEVVQGIS